MTTSCEVLSDMIETLFETKENPENYYICVVEEGDHTTNKKVLKHSDGCYIHYNDAEIVSKENTEIVSVTGLNLFGHRDVVARFIGDISGIGAGNALDIVMSGKALGVPIFSLDKKDVVFFATPVAPDDESSSDRSKSSVEVESEADSEDSQSS